MRTTFDCGGRIVCTTFDCGGRIVLPPDKSYSEPLKRTSSFPQSKTQWQNVTYNGE